MDKLRGTNFRPGAWRLGRTPTSDNARHPPHLRLWRRPRPRLRLAVLRIHRRRGATARMCRPWWRRQKLLAPAVTMRGASLRCLASRVFLISFFFFSVYFTIGQSFPIHRADSSDFWYWFLQQSHLGTRARRSSGADFGPGEPDGVDSDVRRRQHPPDWRAAD